MRAGSASPPLADEVSVDPARLYRTQKIVATLLGALVLLPVAVFAAHSGRFAEFGGWLWLPIAFLGPALHARDAILRGR